MPVDHGPDPDICDGNLEVSEYAFQLFDGIEAFFILRPGMEAEG